MEALVQELIAQNKNLLEILQDKPEKNDGKFSVNFDKFDDTLEKFDSFIERFEAFLDIQNVPDAKRGKVLISSLNAKLYNLLKNLVSPENPADKTYQELITVLKNHLSPKPLIIPSRHCFLNRKQHEGESISNYIAELRSLAIPCEYTQEMLNTMLRDVFVSGLRDRPILDRLFEEDNIDLDKTVQIALAMEKAFRGASDIIGKTEIKAFKAGKLVNDKKPPYQTKPENRNFSKGNARRESCPRCNGEHNKNKCRFITAECRFCHKIGHIERACMIKKKQNSKPVKQKQVEIENESKSENEFPMYTLKSDKVILHEEEPKRPPIMITVKIEGVPTSFEVDTGGAVSVMNLSRFRKISDKEIQPTNVVFKTYNGNKIVPLGYVTVDVEYISQKRKLNLYIVKENLDTIFGREWLYEINVDWNSIKMLKSSYERNFKKLLEEYSEIFDNKLGEINNYEVELKLKPNVIPIFKRARPVPFALKNRVEDEIDRLERDGIIERVETSDWATPVVPVVKPDGSIRLCADYSVTLNPNLEVPQHPLPKLEEIFSSLNGGKHFSKIDFKHAYLQMKVHPETQKMLTINTQKGLYKCKRLMFGLNGAPAIWQRYIDGLFQGLEGCKVFMDDARITGSDDNMHLNTLEKFFKICKIHGLKVNLEKSKFFQDHIEFLGHKIDADGLHKTDEKISAIARAPKPNNIQEVQSFLGLVNFYGKFCPNLATIANPLYHLTKKDTKWVWTKDCQEAFQNIKNELCSPRVLVHYDPKLPVTLATDASPVGLGAVLSHKLPDGTERPIAYASRTLSETEKKYSQIDKEALSIIWGIKKFYLYLKGRRFTLITDHKPLGAIFGCKKGLPELTATRLLHYALILQAYQFDIEYRKTQNHGNADFLSRLPVKSEQLELKDEVELFQLSQIETLPITYKDLEKATLTDDVLKPLLDSLKKGSCLEGKEGEKYTLQGNCVLYGSRVCVPRVYQRKVLEELHSGHLGVVKMKAVARSYVYWKNIDKDIESMARNCADCLRCQKDPNKVQVHYWEYPSTPWERIHVDFAGPFYEHMFLIIVDAYSKWLEVYPMRSITSSATIDCLRDCFARFGLPITLVSDNGPQLVSEEFENFLKMNGIKHKTCAPYKPSSNGQAERYVYTVKQSLRAVKNYPGSIRQKLATFLMHYRKSPNATTMQSPAMLLMKREIRTRIDLLRPDHGRETVERIRKDNHEFTDRVFNIGDNVAVRNYRIPDAKWTFGTVVSRDGQLHYTVDVNGQLWRRHIDQIQRGIDDVQSESTWPAARNPCVGKTQSPAKELVTPQTLPPPLPASPEDSKTDCKRTKITVPTPDPNFVPRRSNRVRKPPDRLNL